MSNPTYITGDILTPNTSSEEVVVCHQVNCRGVMGAGLAKQVRQMYPDAYSAYKEKCDEIKRGQGGLGDVQFCYFLRSRYIIANIFGQDNYGRGRDRYGKKTRYTDYAALRRAFAHIAQVYPNDTIRIPYHMGCGLGGGEWTIVLQIIDEALVSNNVHVEIWKHPG